MKTNRFFSTPAIGALLGAAFVATTARTAEIPFTVNITPVGTYSIEVELKNESSETISGLTISMQGTNFKFDSLFPGSLKPTATVLEPTYLTGNSEWGIVREVWTGIPGNELGFLTGNANYPNRPNYRQMITSDFIAANNYSDNYGQRMHAYLQAPETGNYVFWIYSDDFGQLNLSTDDNPANARQIASVPGYTPAGIWNKYPEQKSAAQSLVAGRYYYISALMKEGGGADNLGVAWSRPGQDPNIPQRLIPASLCRIRAGDTGDALQVANPQASTGGASDTIRLINITGLDAGKSIVFKASLTPAPANAARIMWNNGDTIPNAKVTVYGVDGGRSELVLPDTASNLSGTVYTFRTDTRPRTLRVKSQVDGTGTYVSNYVVRVYDGAGGLDVEYLNPPSVQTIPNLSDGMKVEISAVGAVYLGEGGNFLYDSTSIPSENEQANAQDPARQRFAATGISVNNTPQTGDPTLYSFTVNSDAEINIRWRHEYALTVNHDFSKTKSADLDPTGNPWAGPLTSAASGNPSPDSTKTHWIPKGEEVIAQIDGQVADFSRAGLDIRHAPVRYIACGSARGVYSEHDAYTNVFTVGQSPPQRQQVDSFTMSGWGSITYLWQIQYGVRVNVDDPSRSSLPRVFQAIAGAGGDVEVGSLEGTFWFNPGEAIKVAAPANVTADPTSLALSGWMSGDGYYFSVSGDIDSQNGSLASGGPFQGPDGPVALWQPDFVDPAGRHYRGLSIPSLRRPARVLWTYGEQVFRVTARIGEYVFQNDQALLAAYPPLVTMSQNAPTLIKMTNVSGNNKNVADSDMAIWDPNARQLLPLIPGQFRATWPAPGDMNVHVLVDVFPPEHPHYPHIAESPPVQLTPDPQGLFQFKEVKYTENDAAISDGSLFTSDKAGRTVLLFTEIKKIGRGEPKEYMRVRMVETKLWNDGAAEPATAIIGQAIQDDALDLARLGTGHVRFLNARFNAGVYDAEKLDGLRANAVYDMAALRSTTAQKRVVNRAALPGPVIPVNLHPNAAADERIVVTWYQDPSQTDEILWPHAARTYLPRWPETAAEGLGRIVIASQHGSDGLGADRAEQLVAPAVTNWVPDGAGGLVPSVAPAATTYDPSRIQQPKIYVQPNAALPGYNPNEEHALMAPSLRHAQVSPRPPAAYALRNNDLNAYNKNSKTEVGQPVGYTSHPYVLVQFFDTALDAFRMRVYKVDKEDALIPNYAFANQSMVTPTAEGQPVAASPQTLVQQPHVTMEAGEPVIPFYPLGVVIGASPMPETFGTNIRGQSTYWEDHKGTSWAVSGGEEAWFTFSIHYPMAPDFWWPPGESGRVRYNAATETKVSAFPGTGDSVAFMPQDIAALRAVRPGATVTAAVETKAKPNRILYKSDWPKVAPVLKAGETLTFSGGEYRADHPTMQVVDANGDLQTLQTPGLPGVLAFAVGEVVFDALNPRGDESLPTSSWTLRAAQVLEARAQVLASGTFPQALLPATGRTRVSGGKYVFNDLPASLQKRFRYDPLIQSHDPATGLTISGRMEIGGLVNDKAIGDDTLTAAPPAVYVLEPNILTTDDRDALLALSDESAWTAAVNALYEMTRNPTGLQNASGQLRTGEYLVGLQPKVTRDPVSGLPSVPAATNPKTPEAARQFGPGLALVPNAGFLDPLGTISNPDGTSTPFPDVAWVTVAENNDPSLGGSPVTLHVIKVDRRERYRGAIQTVLSDNVFDENVVLRHTGEFGANADDLVFEWWYRPDDGSLNVPPPFVANRDSAGPWMLFPDLTGNQGRKRAEILLKGNPNAPETLLADSWWFVRYRHKNDVVEDTNWTVEQPDDAPRVNFEWAGAGNNDPFNDFNLDGFMDYRAQLSMGWIKRVLDAVNPYEARIRDFEGDAPATVSSMLRQLGPRFEGPVALNPDKNVIENVGLIELYETVLKRASDLSINLSSPVSTPAIANALQLASTRLSDFYTLLGNEAYTDARDRTIGIGSDAVDYGALSPVVFSFQNQLASLLEEELCLLRGADDGFARPVYNRLFWNFTKGEGEAAYAVNYNISDVDADGFIDEDDAMTLYPQGHGDAWGHYLTALRKQYDLLRHPSFNWVSRAEFYNLMDIVMKVDFLDERKFAQVAAAKARAGAEVLATTYRDHYVEDPEAQWQGYTDVNPDRAWGVQEWARRAGQGAYFDWIAANALLPSEHPNDTLEGIQKVDRAANDDIRAVSANLNKIQQTFDDANNGLNPLRLSSQAVPFDINPAQIDDLVYGRSFFEQMYDRAVAALANAKAVWDNANASQNRLRQVANTEAEFRNDVFQEDLAYKNRLVAIFGRPYDGTVGSGKMYPAGYDGPDLALYMYVDVREINNETVPGPSLAFANFNASGVLTSGDLLVAFNGDGGMSLANADKTGDIRKLLAPSLVADSGNTTPLLARDGVYSVDFIDLDAQTGLDNLDMILPVRAAGYTYQAPDEWGSRPAMGELQTVVNEMMQQEAQVAASIDAWNSLAGNIVRTMRLANAQLQTSADIRYRTQAMVRSKYIISNIIKGVNAGVEIFEDLKETLTTTFDAAGGSVPATMPTVGLAVSPGDVLAPARGGLKFASVAATGGISGLQAAMRAIMAAQEIALDIAEQEVNLANDADEREQARRELLKGLEDLVGDEAGLRLAVFKEIEALRALSDRYRSLVAEGAALVDERAAFNKRVAAMTQSNRYQDMTFRVHRNHALEQYDAMFEIAARYAYLAAKAYDYETNFDPADAASPHDLFAEIVKARTLGYLPDGIPQVGEGGLAEVLARLRVNHEALKGQLGFNNPQTETGKMSLRTERYRILPTGGTQPGGGAFPGGGQASDALWRQTLQSARVANLWDVPEFRRYARPFADDADTDGSATVEPGFVLRFSTSIVAGDNVFGHPLGGGDHAYDPSVFATKIRSVGVWFSDYLSGDVLNDLPQAPRVYLIPVGSDVMSIANAPTPDRVRFWNVVDQHIPVPLPALTADLDRSAYVPLLDSLNWNAGAEARRYSSFRAYHDGGSAINLDELVLDSRLVGRSVWNTEWVLIIPGRTLNNDPDEGLERFIDQVSDIKLVFQTYGHSGN